MATIGTILFTWRKGELVGTDQFDNRYYREKRVAANRRARRWVMYKGTPEASKVPAEWHAWLHYTTDAPLTDRPRADWQQEHVANLTGTAGAYRPPGHVFAGEHRARGTGDYEPWRPN